MTIITHARETKPALTDAESTPTDSLQEVGSTALSRSLVPARKSQKHNNPKLLNPATILSLQRIHGNAYVQRLLAQQSSPAKKNSVAQSVVTIENSPLKEISPAPVPDYSSEAEAGRPIQPETGAPSGCRMVQRGIDQATSLGELYKAKKNLDKKRSHTEFESETKTTTTKVVKFLFDIIDNYVNVNKNLPPSNCELMVLGFGSLARQEMLMVSDVDLQIIMYRAGNKDANQEATTETSEKAAKNYASGLQNAIDAEWNAQLKKTRKHSKKLKTGIRSLKVDWSAGAASEGGIVYIGDTNKLASAMKPQTAGNTGKEGDYFADATVIFQTQQGEYEKHRQTYESKPFDHQYIQKKLNDWGDTLTYRHTQDYKVLTISVKDDFIRNLTLVVGGLYRLYRQKNQLTDQIYLQGTLERAADLQKAGLIKSTDLVSIKELLLRSLQMEEGAGLKKLEHGAALTVGKQKKKRANPLAGEHGKKYIKYNQVLRQNLKDLGLLATDIHTSLTAAYKELTASKADRKPDKQIIEKD